jgi:hypothetical protein
MENSALKTLRVSHSLTTTINDLMTYLLDIHIAVDRATALPSSFDLSRLMRNSLPVAPVQRFVIWRPSLVCVWRKEFHVVEGAADFNDDGTVSERLKLRSQCQKSRDMLRPQS